MSIVWVCSFPTACITLLADKFPRFLFSRSCQALPRSNHRVPVHLFSSCTYRFNHLSNIPIYAYGSFFNLSGTARFPIVDTDISRLRIRRCHLPERILNNPRGVMFIAHHFSFVNFHTPLALWLKYEYTKSKKIRISHS